MPSQAPDWLDTPYVRVYLTLRADHPRVWYSATMLGWYVRLLALADGAWPAPAELPRNVTDDVVAELVDEEIIDVDDDGGFVFHGLDAERIHRLRSEKARGVAGGKARIAKAVRDERSGRLLPANASNDEDAGSLLADHARDNGASLADSLVSDAGEPANQRARHASQPAEDDDFQSSSSSADSESLRARPEPLSAEAEQIRISAERAGEQIVIDCDDYAGHQLSHQRIGGSWRCLICERIRAEGDERFRDKVVRHGGPAW